MTSREWLATAVLVTPARSASWLPQPSTPQRLLVRVETAIAVPHGSRRRRDRDRRARRARPSDELGRWIVLDPAGGIAPRRDRRDRARERARLACSTCRRGAARCSAPPGPIASTGRRCSPSGPSCSQCRSPGNLGAAWLAIEATTAASALLVGFSGRARALEAGWKYLILTSLGLGIALLGILVLEAAAGGGGIESADLALAPSGGARSRDDGRRLCPAARRPRRQDRLGAGAQLAARRALRGAGPVSALLSAALLPAVLLVAWRTQQALAPTIGVRTAGGVLVGFGLASLAVAVPFLWRSAGLEAAPRLLEPRAHGRDRARDRLRWDARTRRRRDPHRRARAREGARVLRRRRRCSHTTRAQQDMRSAASAGPSRALGASLGISLGALAGPAALAALRQRGADRGGRLPGRPAVGRGRSSNPARTRASSGSPTLSSTR